MDRIVVGVDGSAGSQKALEWAVAEARLRHGTVVAIHSWDVPVPAATPVGAVSSAPDDLLSQGAHAILDEALADVDTSDLQVERRVIAGGAANTLVDQSANATLLVVGAAGHGAVMGTLLGSVTQFCTRHASCPVVVMPR
jgi:nucleotide-binding universal stress UspA family protein